MLGEKGRAGKTVRQQTLCVLKAGQSASGLISGKSGAGKGRGKGGECLRDKAGESCRSQIMKNFVCPSNFIPGHRGANDGF